MAKSKNPYRPKRQKTKRNPKQRAAAKEVHEQSIADIILTLNYLLTELKNRGVHITHFDREEERLELIGMFKQKPYFATKTESKDEEVSEE